MIKKLQTKHIFQHTSENFEKLFSKHRDKKQMELETFFSDADIPKLPENQAKRCGENLTEKGLYSSLKSM